MRRHRRSLLAGVVGSLVLLALWWTPRPEAPPAWAQGVGILQRATCTSISSAEPGKTFCFEQSTNTLKFWDGSRWRGQGVASGTVLNVLDYGAVGNGTVDDAPAVQFAVTAATTAVGGRQVYFPGNRSYMFGTAVTGIGTDTTINCQDWSAVLRRGASFTGDMFTLATGSARNTFSNCRYDGNRTATNSAGNQFIQGSSNASLTLVNLYAHDYTDKIINAYGANPDFRMLNNLFVNSWRRGVMSLSASRAIINGNRFLGMNDSCIDLIDGDDGLIANNVCRADGTVEATNDGIVLNAGNRMVVSGNRVYTTTGRAIWYTVGDSSRTTGNDLLISGNSATGSVTNGAIRIDGLTAGATQRIRINGNVVDGGPIIIYDAQDIAVTNNTLAGYQAQINLNATTLNIEDVLIAGNTHERPNQAPYQFQADPAARVIARVLVHGNRLGTVTLTNGRQGIVYGYGAGTVGTVTVTNNAAFGILNKLEGQGDVTFINNVYNTPGITIAPDAFAIVLVGSATQSQGNGTVNVASAVYLNSIPLLVASAASPNLTNLRGLSASHSLSNNLRGACNFAAAVTCAVTFGANEPDAHYFVITSGLVDVTARTRAGFTLTATGTTSSTVDWLLVR